MKIKPSLSKGTRDFLPHEVAKRNYIFETIKSVFRKYGFEQIETPAIERLETLTGKYGEEGDKLLFKILNSGDYLQSLPEELLTTRNSQSATKHLSEKGLRYDLTVPLARYVVQHQDKLAFPFRRFHIGPVWRADRPQKGRYQEFYQCDADVIGSSSMWNEVELTKIYLEVFQSLGINVTIQINNRKILQGIASYFGCENRFEEFVTIIDKLDKIDYSGVIEEFKKQGFDLNAGVETLDENGLSYFREGLSSNYSWEKLTVRLKELFSEQYCHNPTAQKGADELSFVTNFLDSKVHINFNPYLARGLNYYTGMIWEVVLDKNHEPNKSIAIGSLGGGGRYDNLTEMFGGQNMSGVGISFGIERIYDVMEELNLFPENVSQGVKILFVPREPANEEFTFQQVQALRNAGIAAEIFLGNVKKQKQFTYAEAKHIPLVAEVGTDEMATGIFRVRETATRQEQKLTLQQIIGRLQ